MKSSGLHNGRLSGTVIIVKEWIIMHGLVRNKEMNQFIFDIVEMFISRFLFSKGH